MKVLFFVVFFGVGGALPADERPPLQVVPEVDLERYSGTWFEIARLPNEYQKDCRGDVMVDYSLREDGKLDVINRCRKDDGAVEEARGVARLASEDGSTAKLKVRFAPGWLSFLPFVWGDYWVLELSPDYRYALIGEPERRYLWILSRTAELEQSVIDELLAHASDRGYDVDRVTRTSHTEPPAESRPR